MMPASQVSLSTQSTSGSDTLDSRLLNLYSSLRNLPETLPEHPDIYPFAEKFALDQHDIEFYGSQQGALNHRLELIFGSRSTGNAIQFKGRGRPLEAIVYILKKYINGDDGENILLWKWVKDLTNAANQMSATQKKTPRIESPIVAPVKLSPSGRTGSKRRGTTRTPRKRRTEAAINAAKAASSIRWPHDPADLEDYTSTQEPSGRERDDFLDVLTIPCKSKVDETHKRVRCSGTGCWWSWAEPRTTAHILKHAQRCNGLSTDLREEIQRRSASLSLASRIQQQSAGEATTIRLPTTEEIRQKEERVNHALLKWLCDRMIPPSAVDCLRWREFVASLDDNVSTASGSTISDNFVTTEAAYIRKESINLLSQSNNLTLSYDGGTTRGHESVYKLEGTVKTEYEALQQRLQVLLKVLASHSDEEISPMVSSKIKGVREFIEGELKSIGKRSSEKQHGRFLVAKEEQERFLGCCRRIQEYMEKLSLDTTLATWKLEEEQSQDRMASWIRLLPSSPSAWYNSSAGADLKRRECTRGTRVDVLANLLGWANSSSMDAVYWLNGMAGTGKTTIAYSVCEELAGKHRLAASFFCSRQLAECNDVNRIFPSIAHQLAQLSPPFRSALSAVMEKNQDAHHKALTEQFEALFRGPLLAAKPSDFEGSVIVIDALDECTNKESTRDILEVLLNKVADLPIKFIVSSRPESQIRDQMDDERVRFRLVLHELDTGHVKADIETYLREELKPMKPSPSEAQIAALIKKAGILFIYAATAVRYIGHDNFKRNAGARLRKLLDGGRIRRTRGHEEIDEIDQLYMTILEAALSDRGIDEDEQDDIEQVIYTAICAREPLTVGELSELLQIKDVERVRAALRPLWSVLHVVGASELVTTLHASFPDFMFDPTRSKAYHCDLGAHNHKLAEHCFERIKRTQPQFNIVGLESSYLPDEMVPNIDERVAKAIPSDLLYACRYWADHVETGKCASTLVVQLRDLLSTRLLVWMEVLNLTKQMKTGVECMKLMAKWFDQLEGDEELVELLHDAQRFVGTFTSNTISQSTPHIYVSMLGFWPKSGPIAKHYAQLTHGPVQAEGTALDRCQPAHLATWVFEKAIKRMAVSQDGWCIALRSDQDVLVVDSSSGRVVLGPLHSHSGNIQSIIFLPNETRVLAGLVNSSIATIIGWDTHHQQNPSLA